VTFDSTIHVFILIVTKLLTTVSTKKSTVNRENVQVSQKWRTNDALRCRRDYRKRQKNVKKKILDLFADLAVFESGT
jgi:hypothetical protein